MMLAAMLTLAALAAPAVAQGPAPTQDHAVAALRGLDKFSGLTSDFDAVIGAPVDYARLRVTLRACRADADGENATAYLEILDTRDGSAPFSGWMFAEDPAVSALDHPRYDVWVLRCKTSSGGAP